MLKHLNIRNFTVFAEADFEFSPGLNVIVGTNGTGKSHVLKLGYAVEVVRAEVKNIDSTVNASRPIKREGEWYGRLFYELPDVFQTPLKELISFGAANGIGMAGIGFQVNHSEDESVRFEISSEFENLRLIGGGESISEKASSPIFIPAKEILTLSWILPGSKQLIAPIEKNYLDLLNQLRLLPLRNPDTIDSVQMLTDVLGGEVREEGDRYYLVDKAGRRTGINMVAEGLRKFGTLQKLLTNGSLTKNTTLYWDEPEANLNPALLQKLAAVIVELARQGFQIILATHSLFLLKEFHILAQRAPTPIRYFGLYEGPDGATQVETTDDFETLEHIAALDAELEQTVDFQQALDHDDAN